MSYFKSSYFKILIKVVLAVIVIYFAGRHLFSNWSEVTRYDWDFNLYYLILSVLLYQITLIFFAKAWCVILKSFGHDIPLKLGFRISNLANLGWYIPGKFWHVFGMMYMLKKINIEKEAALASWAIAYIYSILSALLIGVLAMSFNREILAEIFISVFKINLNVYVLVTLTAAVSLIFIMAPNYAIKFYNYIMTKIKRPVIKFRYDIRNAVKIYLIYFIAWIIYGTAFYFLCKGLIVDSDLPLTLGIGAIVSAHIIGLLAFFSPGGLGVREIILQTMLIPFFGPIVSGLVLAARIWSLVIEFMAFGIALLIKFENNGGTSK